MSEATPTHKDIYGRKYVVYSNAVYYQENEHRWGYLVMLKGVKINRFVQTDLFPLNMRTGGLYKITMRARREQQYIRQRKYMKWQSMDIDKIEYEHRNTPQQNK